MMLFTIRMRKYDWVEGSGMVLAIMYLVAGLYYNDNFSFVLGGLFVIALIVDEKVHRK